MNDYTRGGSGNSNVNYNSPHILSFVGFKALGTFYQLFTVVSKLLKPIISIYRSLCSIVLRFLVYFSIYKLDSLAMPVNLREHSESENFEES